MKEQFKQTAHMLLKIQQKIKYLREIEQKTASRLREICDGETTSFDGYKYQKIDRLGPIRYCDIPQLKQLDLEIYRDNPVTSWKLTYQEQFEELLGDDESI